MRTQETELIKALLECVEQAIRTGDWNVDGRNDPDMILERAEGILIEAGYRRDGWTGEEFIYEG